MAVGIDGGGTRTRAALVREDGRVLGRGEGPSGNLHDVGAASLARHVDAAWRAAWAAAGEAPRAADVAFLGMASVGTEADRAAVRDVAADVGLAPAGRVHVDIDLAVSLAGGLAGAPGIALIVGTGSSCYGRTADGRAHQAGGWGSLLDDVGSATWLGTRAMTAAVRDFDGRGPATVLRERVAEALALEHLRDLLRLVDHDGLARARRAALAPLVTAAADEGDAVARALVDEGADALAECVEAVARALAWDAPPLPVVATGGLARVATMTGALDAALARRVPHAQRVEPRLDEVLGAALLAFERLGVALDPDRLS